MNTYQNEEKLRGRPLERVLRACDIFALNFEDGSKEYALHVQCTWRLLRASDNRILSTREDVFTPARHIKDTDHFEWDKLGNNHLDEIISQYLRPHLPLHVIDVTINEWADISMHFAEGLIFQAFADTAISDKELWRFFQRTDLDSHIIAYPGRLVHE